MLSFQYIQKGLLFTKPSSFQLDPLLQKIKEFTLNHLIVHFNLLAGRFKTLKQENPPLYTVFIDQLC